MSPHQQCGRPFGCACWRHDGRVWRALTEQREAQGRTLVAGAMLSGGAPPEGQRTAALKDKLAALKHNVGRRPRKSATGDTGPAPGDAAGEGDALRSWRQRRGRADGPGGAADVDWDFIDAAASGEPGSTAARERRNDVTEGAVRGQFEAAAVERRQPSPTSQVCHPWMTEQQREVLACAVGALCAPASRRLTRVCFLPRVPTPPAERRRADRLAKFRRKRAYWGRCR